MNSEPILIAGTGALACLFAARLVKSGAQTAILGSWPEGLTALRRYGARLITEAGEVESYPVGVIDNPDNCPSFRHGLVLVKSWQTERTAQQLSTCLAEDGTILTLQNGLGNRETLAGTLGDRRVTIGSTTTGATLLAPGQVRPGGEGTIHVEESDSLKPLIFRLAAAGFKVQHTADVEALVWGKLVINAAINPLTALLGIPNGELLERPSARELMGAVARETAAVAEAKGITLPFANPAAAAEEVAQRTASNNSSMFQDIQRGAPTEIDAICGAIFSAADELGLAVPVNKALWQLVISGPEPFGFAQCKLCRRLHTPVRFRKTAIFTIQRRLL
jgi:2-dehydropantoate 2-reductase